MSVNSNINSHLNVTRLKVA